MADLIDRQSALDAVHRDANPFLEYAASQIEQLPTIEIVRCRECKHRDAEDGFCKGRGWPMQLVPEDGFCDKGERRSEDE